MYLILVQITPFFVQDLPWEPFDCWGWWRKIEEKEMKALLCRPERWFLSFSCLHNSVTRPLQDEGRRGCRETSVSDVTKWRFSGVWGERCHSCPCLSVCHQRKRWDLFWCIHCKPHWSLKPKAERETSSCGVFWMDHRQGVLYGMLCAAALLSELSLVGPQTRSIYVYQKKKGAIKKNLIWRDFWRSFIIKIILI